MQFLLLIFALVASGAVGVLVYHGHFDDDGQSRRLGNSLRAGGLSLFALCAAATGISDLTIGATQQALHATAVAAHREKLLGFVASSGRLNPIPNSALVMPPAPSQSAASVWFVVAVVAASWLLYRRTGTMIKGWYWVRVPHPAAKAVTQRWDEPIDGAGLGKALRSDPSEIEDPPPAYQSEALKRKADALKRKLEADAAVADAAVERERARKRKERAA